MITSAATTRRPIRTQAPITQFLQVETASDSSVFLTGARDQRYAPKKSFLTLCRFQEETQRSLSNVEPSFLSTLLHVTWLGPLVVSAAHFFCFRPSDQPTEAVTPPELRTRKLVPA